MGRTLIVLFALVGSSCRSPSPSDASPPEAAAGVPLYSPFVVEVQTEAPFNRVSFKQVGSFRGEDDRSEIFEAMAESLAYELSKHGATSHATFTPEVADPTHHLACGSSHIYVDFWESEDAVFGFSLWSGCGEESRFAHEVELSLPTDRDLIEKLEPLARRIASRLIEARDTDCFNASC
ncbi:MAG: hypothetical protein AAGD10_03105 [Myxococcota bacterium]